MPTAPPPRTSRMREPCCETMGIPLHRVSFACEYRDRVFAHSLRSMPRAAPRTRTSVQPGDQVRRLPGLYAPPRRSEIATGHYARVACADAARAPRARLLKAADQAKDQSYFLHGVAPAALADTLFPLGELCKDDVRRRAHAAGLRVYDKPDSTGICFIGERPFQDFLSRYLKSSAGPIETPEAGFWASTADSRSTRSASVRAWRRRQGGRGGGALVRRRERHRSQCAHRRSGSRASAADVRVVRASRTCIGSPAPDDTEFECAVKTRYRQDDLPCSVRAGTAGPCTCRFPRPARAVTPGQYAVFYEDDFCLGGGVIADGTPRCSHAVRRASSLIILYFRWRGHDG